MDLIKFDPTVDTLHKIIEKTSKITATDLSDEAQLAVVKENRIQLRDARITIEKQGKSMREDALKYQKDVIAREKELLAIILPEEDRLADIEHEAKAIKTRAARMELLPMRRQELSAIGISDIGDEALLDLDNDQFSEFLNKCKADFLDKQMAEVNAEKARLADEARLAQVRKDAEVAERNRVEAEAQRKVDAAKAESDRVIRQTHEKEAQRKAQEEAAKREAEVREQEAKDKQSKLEKQKKYKAWLEKIGYTETEHGSWYFATKDDVTSAYKLISSFKS